MARISAKRSSQANLGKSTSPDFCIKQADVQMTLPIVPIRKVQIEPEGITASKQLLQFPNTAGTAATPPW